ncbi:MltA-interacting MipA family protein [Dickeya parazeae Ech586]|uniref:MltA-interacting MipA family protein n=1 Tax=Dickeya zeae (strain Ech586) TaxID=590409 RepID=D2C0U8_DICZ5|nr:MipA/OmpV family protein [Dickeya parazeae]ACZ77019.1 MltA-interacting MipA family protein [Dickeya parazeae Ech586]
MKKHVFTFLTATLAGAVTTGTALAEEFSLGVGAVGGTVLYRGDSGHVYPFPMVNYDGDNFYLRGLQGGYYLWNDSQNKLSLTAYYNPFGFRPGDSDDSQMKQLDRRRGTLMAGLAYRYDAQWGTLRTVFAGDTLDYSNGLVWDSAYLYRFNAGNWSLTPGVGVTWSSENQNRYYYGVTGDEAARSGLRNYQPNDGWSPYVELSAGYQINSNWSSWVSGRYIHLSDEVKDSPMVDKSYNLMLGGGVSYRF